MIGLDHSTTTTTCSLFGMRIWKIRNRKGKGRKSHKFFKRAINGLYTRFIPSSPPSKIPFTSFPSSFLTILFKKKKKNTEFSVVCISSGHVSCHTLRLLNHFQTVIFLIATGSNNRQFRQVLLTLWTGSAGLCLVVKVDFILFY